MFAWRRNRIIDVDRLCWRLGTAKLVEVRGLERSLSDRMARHELKREAGWTESLAVGSNSFLERIEPEISFRRKAECRPRAICGSDRNVRFRMGEKTALKNAPWAKKRT